MQDLYMNMRSHPNLADSNLSNAVVQIILESGVAAVN